MISPMWHGITMTLFPKFQYLHKKMLRYLDEKMYLGRWLFPLKTFFLRYLLVIIECPGKSNLLSACLLICQFLFWQENRTEIKSVDMWTNEQIWFFSADRRPGTKFLCRLSPWESEPSLFPKDRKTHDSPLHTNIQPPHHKPFLSFMLTRGHWWVKPVVVDDSFVKSTMKRCMTLSAKTKIQRVLAPPPPTMMTRTMNLTNRTPSPSLFRLFEALCQLPPTTTGQTPSTQVRGGGGGA